MAAASASATPGRSRLAGALCLYLLVIAAVVLGVVVGFAAPGFAKQLKPLGTVFVDLVKMMISPIVFCAVVSGVGSARRAAKVGVVGGVALAYFLTMSTVALAIGLGAANVLHPGSVLDLSGTAGVAGHSHVEARSEPAVDFLLGVIPTTLMSAFTGGEVLQTLLVALLVGIALQTMGAAGEPILRGVGHLQRLMFRVLAMIRWVAPVGAFGAIAAVVGETGADALIGLAMIMLGFYASSLVFVFVVLGALLRLVSGIGVFKLLRYLRREFLLILSASSSELALPTLMAKMEHLGVSRPVVGITVPTGYSFNLDGTSIYLAMASLFVAEAIGKPLSIGEQVSLLAVLVIAASGAAGLTGAGLATLVGGLHSHQPDLLEGVGLIVGIDRFMSEARAMTTFAGNAIGTVVVGAWTKELDKQRARQVLAGALPFDETVLSDDGGIPPAADGGGDGAASDTEVPGARGPHSAEGAGAKA